jgi:hypothetical protein
VFWDVPPFLQEPHGVTSQKTAFFVYRNINSINVAQNKETLQAFADNVMKNQAE